MSQKKFLTIFVFLLFVPFLSAEKISLFIGTNGPSADGIYHTFFDQKTGKFSPPERVAEVQSPNFLAIHPDGEKIYAVCRWQNGAGVIGYRVSHPFQLVEFTRMNCPDGMGCHIAIHPDGNFLLTTQYSGGSVAFFPLDERGILGHPTITEHSGGSGIIKSRQSNPHPHWCGFSPCGNFALVPDLGLDQIVIYQVDEKRTKIVSHGTVKSVPGGGPRHMRFSIDGRWIFLLNELSLSISTFSWNKTLGQAFPVSSTPTLDDEIKDGESFNSAAEILVHPSGRWVYSSNRGHDSVSVFSKSEQGKLTRTQVQPVRGAFPRNINLSPNGMWLLAAGQDSNTISGHKIDSGTGLLTYQRGSITNAPNPVCLVFHPTKKYSKK